MVTDDQELFEFEEEEENEESEELEEEDLESEIEALIGVLIPEPTGADLEELRHGFQPVAPPSEEVIQRIMRAIRRGQADRKK